MATIFTDLQDQIINYFSQFILTLPQLAVGIIAFLIIWIIANKLRNKLVSSLTERTSDILMARFAGRILNISLIVLGIIVFFKIVGLGGIAAGMMGTAGVSAFIIGFAFKDIGENFLAGFILAFNRPFNIGDLVELGGHKGNVVGLNIRDTHLKTFDGRDLFIPNANIIKQALINYTIDGYIRQEINLGLDYDADLENSITIILDALNSIPGILKEDKKPSVAIAGLGDSSLNLSIYYWLNTFDKSINGANIRIKATNKILTDLGSKGVYLPGNILEIKNYNESIFHQKSLS